MNHEPDKKALELRIKVAKRELDSARVRGDDLNATLIEEALNDLLDRYFCNACYA